jgi:cytochrome P450
METLPSQPLDDDWWAHHFDYLSPQVTQDLYPALARLRARCPVAHSDQHGGHWVVTRYEDVLRVAQDWEAFSSALGVGIPHQESTMLAIPESIDPPVHRVYKRLINAYLTPAVVRGYEEPTRALIDGLIDEFIDAGTCDFMPAFARIFPGRAFFEFVLNAPTDEVAHLNDLATGVSMPTNPDIAACWAGLARWIDNLVEQRRGRPRSDDIVDAILHADIEGRPVTHEEVRALIVLLILGGLETTAGALGHFMIRFCREPEIPALLRQRPELVPDAVEELLRLDTPFVFVGRTVRHAGKIARQRVEPGQKVLISWAAANRDEAEFAHPDTFDLERPSNRHVAFGAGPHRCAGSNLARMNLRLAVEELVPRLHDTKLLTPVENIPYHSAYNRAPQSLAISFIPGRRLATTPPGASPA